MKTYQFLLKLILVFGLLLILPISGQVVADECDDTLELIQGAGNSNGAINTHDWTGLETWDNNVYTRNYSGNKYLYITATKDNAAIYQSFSTTIGREYQVTAKLLGTDVNRDEDFSPGNTYVTVEASTPTLNSSAIERSPNISGGTEQTISFTFTATSTTSYITIRSTNGWRYANARDISVKAICNNVVNDEIISFSAPSEVQQGQTITATVEYSASEQKDLYLKLQYNHSPWTSFASSRVTVNAGTGTATLSLTVPSDMTINNDYLFEVLLTTVGGGWSERSDAKWVNPVAVIAADDSLPCTVETANNQIKNACFEQTNTPWNSYGSRAAWVANEGHSGTHSVKLENRTSQKSRWHYPEFDIDHKRTVKFGGWSKALNVSSDTLYALDFKVTFADDSTTWFTEDLHFTKGTHGWENREITKTFTKDIVKIKPYVLNYYGTGTIWYDDIYVIVDGDDTPPEENNAPIASAQSVATTENTAVNITLTGSDPDGDPIYYSIVTGPSHGSLSGTEPNITYTPDTDYIGSDSFVYQVCENTHLPDALCSTEETISITISEASSSEESTGAIKPLEFTWKDDQANVYYPSGGNSKESVISTIHFYDEKLHVLRTIDAIATFKYPDVYKFNSLETKTIYTMKNGNQQSRTVDPYNVSEEWQDEGTAAFSSPDLNYYIGGNSPNGVEDATYPNRPTAYTVRHLLSYTDGVKVGNGGDGYVIVSERGGNNHFYLLARDLNGNELGNIFIRMTSHYTCSQSNPVLPVQDGFSDHHIDPYSGWEVDYWASGRMQENGQEICVAVYPIQDLAPAGATIGSIEMWAASRDPGDGKVMLVSYLDEPEICYDYTVSLNENTISSENRDINISQNGDIAISVGIKSEEGDVVMTHSQIQVTLSPADKVAFKDAQYSPNTSNTLIDAIHIHDDVHQTNIAIGSDATNSGGTIGAKERYFSKFNYTMNSDVNTLDGHFEIDLNVTTDPTGLNPIIYFLSSRNGTLPRCAQSKRYNPIWGQFNIERPDSGELSPQNPANKKFPLYTQIAGKPFGFSLVAYDANATPAFSQELITPIDITAEVELIKATAYDDNTSFFKCQNTDASIIQTFPSGEKSFLKTIPAGESRADFADAAIGTKNALKKAVFRMWMLVDKNGTIIPHNYTDKTDVRFRNLYNTYLKNDDSLKLCDSTCNNTPSLCYQCLRDHFAIPICSRDDFSVRPDSYSMAVHDSNESENPSFASQTIGNNSNTAAKTLAAGYAYKLDVNATQYNDPHSVAKGYNISFKEMSDNLKSELQFDSSTGVNCADTENKPIAASFYDGSINGIYTTDGLKQNANNLFHNTNVGKYAYHIEDQNWTIIDQSRYAYKTYPDVDDCKVDDSSTDGSSIVRNGCRTDSKDINDLNLVFNPYSFDVTSIYFAARPIDNHSWLYMNDLSHSMDMAAFMDGNITAKGKDGSTLSNFTSNCAAEKVNLWVDKNITHSPDSGNPNTILDMTNRAIPLQQYLWNTPSSDSNISIVYKSTFVNNSDTNGSAPVHLSFNFAKPYDIPVNPVDVNFSTLHASSPDAKSNAHLEHDYTPEGNTTFNESRYFLFAKVAPKLGDEYITTYDSNYTTILRVNTYCKNVGGINCGVLQGLNILGTLEESIYGSIGGGWYRASTHGEFHGKVATLSADGEGITEVGRNDYNNKTLDNNGSTSDIVLTYPEGEARPADFVLTIDPDEWLKYDFNTTDTTAERGKPKFSIHYRSHGLRWKGTGDTGNVIETQPNSGLNKRMSW